MKLYKHHFIEKESDITIISESQQAITQAKEVFYLHRQVLENYIKNHQKFLTSFSPMIIENPEKIIKIMSDVSILCDVGPMAAVAGAFADLMLEEMSIINPIPLVKLVENGGELAIETQEPLRIALFAGFNELNLNLGFLIRKQDCPVGIGTSSSTFGHAVSLGKADAVTVFATTAALADAAATRIANEVKGNDIEGSIKHALNIAEEIEGLKGTLISRENRVGQIGTLPKIFKIEGDKSTILKEKFNSVLSGDYEIIK